jgi:hypothetical protein
MNNKIFLSLTVLCVMVSSSLLAMRSCCSHSVTNKSGREVHVFALYGMHGSIRTEYNIKPGEVRKFKTDQGTVGSTAKTITNISVIVDKGDKQGRKATPGTWNGNSNWEIQPDLSVTG